MLAEEWVQMSETMSVSTCLYVKFAQQSISPGFRSIRHRNLDFSVAFCRKCAEHSARQIAHFGEKVDTKCPRKSGKFQNLLKLSGNDVLVSRSYWESFSYMATLFDVFRDLNFWKRCSFSPLSVCERENLAQIFEKVHENHNAKMCFTQISRESCKHR